MHTRHPFRRFGVIVANLVTLFLFVTSSAVATEVWSPWSVPAGGIASDMTSLGGSEPSPIIDAMGDAIDAFGAGPPLLDIDTVHVTFDNEGSELSFLMTFHTPISPPSSGAADSLVGFLEFDTDQNAFTGIDPLQNFFSPPFSPLGTGVDFLLDLSSDFLHPGFLDVIDTSFFGVVGTIPVTYGAMSLEGVIPLSILGNDDGVVDFTSIIGTFPQPTDTLDVVGFSVPEPTTLTVLAVGAFLIVAPTRRRR